MLKIEENEKIIEYKGEKITLVEPSAKKQTDFAILVEKEKDHKKQLTAMINYVEGLGVKKKVANELSLNSLQTIIEYVHGVEKK